MVVTVSRADMEAFRGDLLRTCVLGHVWPRLLFVAFVSSNVEVARVNREGLPTQSDVH